MTIDKQSEYTCFGGRQLQFTHTSRALNCQMRFSIFLPPAAESETVPVLYWLSGLTCTDENFVQKAGAQRIAAELGLAIVTPDTSPRGESVPDDPDGSYDFGLGAGFYLNATQAPWNQHYRMYDYIVEELPELIQKHFPINIEQSSIFGHSMGGHGALTIGLKNPSRYQSISAFAPIVAPTQCPWGIKALSNYLGDDTATWKDYDSCELIKNSEASQAPMLIDQGKADAFLEEQLKPSLLEQAARESGYALTLRMHPDYDHSYFFIATFIEDHLRFHREHLA